MLSRRRLLQGAAAALAVGACTTDDAEGPSGPSSSPDEDGERSATDPQSRPIEQRVADFLANPDANGAALLALAMADTGDVRWVPHLLDLLRLSGDELANGQIMVALQRLTGRYVLDDVTVAFVEFGGWMLKERPEPAPGYPAFKIVLYRRVDPIYAEVLGAIDDPRLLSEIHWGGVIPGGIPELNRPARAAADAMPAGAALTDDELVFGLVLGGVAVAYPERVLGYHELANDVVGADAIVVSYCPLCRSARAAFADGRTMRTSGLLRSSNKLMLSGDGGLWQQQSGEAVSGPERGTVLRRIDIETTSWAEWRQRHPNTEVVRTPEPGQFPTTSYRYEPFGAYATYDLDSGAWFPVLEPPGGLPLKATVATVSLGSAALAIDVEVLARKGPAYIEWPGSTAATVLAVTSPGGAWVYDASRSSLRTPPRQTDHQRAVLADGTTLEALPSGRAYWFAWYGEHPTTTWWPA